MSEIIMNIDNVCKISHTYIKLNNISFEIESQNTISILGKNEEENILLLKVLSGLLSYDNGTITFMNKNFKKNISTLIKSIGLCFIGIGFSNLTVKEYLYYLANLYNKPLFNINFLLEKFKFNNSFHKKIKSLSKDSLHILSFIRALINDPKLIILYEPSLSTNFETTQIIRNNIVELAKKDIGILLITSSYDEAQSISNKIGILDNGSIHHWEDTNEKPPINEMFNSTEKIKLNFDKIPIKVNNSIMFLNPNEIMYIESVDGLIVIFTDDKKFQCKYKLIELENKLITFGFFRTHKSYIVNLKRIREIIPWTRNSYSIILDDSKKTVIPLSKNSLKNLEKNLDL